VVKRTFHIATILVLVLALALPAGAATVSGSKYCFNGLKATTWSSASNTHNHTVEGVHVAKPGTTSFTSWWLLGSRTYDYVLNAAQLVSHSVPCT
jgi:hypothetical protein